ncbi:molybdopterin-dependent oxidoreductase [Gordonibacter pamelaeae]|uniref:molybdopterin-dependent oxidoreductase n=1 Tax=Gordonibacter pamelaeae TaxID=471189 RepID=UPI0026664F32|nr:molybdopterin-dependent oxidoreductase [Gordonibacter pamelaeae]
MDQANSYYEAHKGEVEWRDGDYTVTRTTVWSGPGCHDGCGVLYYTKDGKLEKVEGDPDCPFNQGTLCMRCLEMPEAVNHPDRPTGPLKRAGERGENKWESVTWDEAYDIIEEKVRAIWKDYGAESIACMIGTGRNNCWQIPYLCYAAFGSPNFCLGFLSGESCFQPRSAAMASMNGDFLIADMSQQFESRYDTENTEWVPPEMIVVWGCNPIASNSDNFYGGWVVDCMQRGSRLITVDPSLTWLAARSDYWLRLRPGTDGALALAMLNVIISEDLYDHEFVEKWCYGFDELAERVKEWTPERAEAVCWVPKDTIIGAARAYAKAKPATIHWGLPIDQAVVGIPTAQAINALWAVTGNTDVPGGNIIIRNAFEQNVSYNYGYQTLPAEVQAKRIGAEYPLMSKAGFSSTAHSDSILQAIETGKPYPIRMLWLSSTNPIANMASDAPRVYRAVRTLDFVVVSDPFLTPTAVAFADVFLPASMSCERNTQRVWWVPLRGMKKVTQFADVRSDDTIVTDLGRRLHPENFPWTDDIGWTNDILVNDTPGYDGDFEQLCKDVYVYPAFEYRKHEKGLLRPDGQPGFNTPSGRIELYNSIFALWGYDPLPQWEEPSCSPYASPELYEQYPFVLTTGARSVEFFHSEHRQLETSREFHPDPLFEMSPKAAEAAGLSEGDWCWLENHRGRCRQKLHVNPSLDDRVVRAEHGWWFPEQEAAEPVLFGVFDSNINNLLPQCENGPTGYGAPYKNQLCRVYACTEENSAELPTACVTRKDGYSK